MIGDQGRAGAGSALCGTRFIETHLDDPEDVYLAEQTLERLRRGEEEIVSAQEFWRGLDD